MKKKLILLLICLSTQFLFYGQEKNSEGPFSQLIIRGVMLINGNGAPPRGPVDIVVEKNIITKIQVVGYPGVAIEESRRPKLKVGGKELDCNGMYLMPGFIDMHGHIGGKSQGADYDYVFKLWMAHGITTVREPSGRGIDWTLDLKRKSAKNEIVAPRIFAYTGFGQGSKETISTPEMAREWVRNNAKKGSGRHQIFWCGTRNYGCRLRRKQKIRTTISMPSCTIKCISLERFTFC